MIAPIVVQVCDGGYGGNVMKKNIDEIGVGIVIAHDPLLGPGRALVSASGSYRG